MKPRPQLDFTVGVRHEVVEHAGLKCAEVYRGVFSVRLNYLPTIYFVPKVDGLAESWPPVLPKHEDDSQFLERDARLESLLSGYAVTPNVGLGSATLDVDVKTDESEWISRIRFVDQARYSAMEAELYELAEDGDVSSVTGGLPISQLAEYEVVRFIVEELVLSDFLQERDREWVTPLSPNERESWRESSVFREWRIELNDMTRAGVVSLLETLGLETDMKRPGAVVATATGRRAFAVVLRRGPHGLDDFRITITEGDRILDWRGALAALENPYQICRSGAVVHSEGYVDRTTQVASSQSFSSPHWQSPRTPDVDYQILDDAYRFVTHLDGFGSRELWAAESRDGTPLLGTISPAKVGEEQRAELRRSAPGLLVFEGIATLADGRTVLFERLPEGQPLSTLRSPITEAIVARLLSQVGRVLLQADEANVPISTVRPPLIWCVEQDSGLSLSGLTDRSSLLFSHESPHCFSSTPLWVRRYAPESETGSNAHTFNLALLFIELVTRSHPIDTRLFADYVDLMPTIPSSMTLLSERARSLVKAGLHGGMGAPITLSKFLGELEELY